MTLTKYTRKTEDEDSEIYKFIDDKRIIRVLFKNNIYSLREIQKEAIKKGLYFNISFLVVAPSGSGKTLIGELCIINNVFKKLGKSIYLVPYKALASEKYYYLKRNYSKFGIKTEISIGDIDVDDEELEKANIIVTTYEKMDSILRSFKERTWIHSISTIIIDEIHSVGEKSRGPRLESLIVRLNEFLICPQIIALSATIANPEFFSSWLSTLGQEFILIKSFERPVPLKYAITLTQKKDSTIKHYIKGILEKNGQLIIFVNTRKDTQRLALQLKDFVKKRLSPQELSVCNKIARTLESIKGGISELKKCIKGGVVFHHAGLLPKERFLIEENFNRRILKVICCTTTLSAGLNLPARMVIIKDFKKYETRGRKNMDLSKLHEGFGDGLTFFEPFSANQIFQMLGRAGRPGMDSIGYGMILAKNIEEKGWIEEHYFKISEERNKLVPVYDSLQSAINSTETLREQVLLRIYEHENITIEELKEFFEKTYFWYCIKDRKVPIDEFLRIKEITPKNILKLHSNPEILEKISNSHFQNKITHIDKDSIQGFVKNSLGIYNVRFHIEKGISCSCNFNNRTEDNLIDQFSYNFIFCNHISSFLLYLISINNQKLRRYVDDIIPKSVRDEYIIDYLIEKGLVVRKENILNCTSFGQLIIKLYLYPSSGVEIRRMLEDNEIINYKSLIKCAFNVLKFEGRVRDHKMEHPLTWWADEEPLQNILDEFKIYAGDLFSIKENIIRIIVFIGVISSFLDQDNIANMCETLSIRLIHGIREELFDLVLRLKNVGRVRARALYNAGYHTVLKVISEDPYTLQFKSGLVLSICKSIIKSYREKKAKNKEDKFEGFKALI